MIVRPLSHFKLSNILESAFPLSIKDLCIHNFLWAAEADLQDRIPATTAFPAIGKACGDHTQLSGCIDIISLLALSSEKTFLMSSILEIFCLI
jgi:hypothetical protein